MDAARREQAMSRCRLRKREGSGDRDDEVFAEFGFSEGVAGHITARDPEFTDTFWVNPFGMHFGHIRASDLCLVDHNGEVVQGDECEWPTGLAGLSHNAPPLAARLAGRARR